MAEDIKDVTSALSGVAKQLADNNQRAEGEAKEANARTASLKSSLAANGQAIEQALISSNKAKGVGNAQIAAQQNETLGKLAAVNKDIEATRLNLLKNEEKIKKAEEEKDRKAYDELAAQRSLLEKDLEKQNEKAGNLKTDYEATKDETEIGGDDESAVQVDPNQTPDWALKLTDSFDLSNLLTKEGFANMGDKFLGLADKIGNSKVGQAAKGLFDVFADLAKTVFMVIGGFTAFNGFMDGMEKATEWFGEGAGFKELIASGIAGLLDAFGLAGDEAGSPAELAHKIVAVFDWITEKITWMFNSVKSTVTGLMNFADNFDKGVEQLKNGDIIGGIKTLFTTFIDDFLGSFNMGTVAALALFAPKLTMSILWWGAKTLLPKVIGFLAKSVLPALWSMITSLGSFIMTTVLPALGTLITSFFTVVIPAIGSLVAGLAAAAVPLLVAAAPFIAIAAAVALVIAGLVKGFEEGMAIFEETGSIVEGLKAGLSKMVGFIVGFVPDLLKDIVSWAARALGFDSFADDLDSFSFTDMITDAFRNVMNWFETLPLKLQKGLYTILNSIIGMRGDFDEDIAEIEGKLAAKDEKFAKTDDIVNRRRDEAAAAEAAEEAAELAAEQAEEEAERLKEEEAEKKGGGWFSWGGDDDDDASKTPDMPDMDYAAAAAAPITNQTVHIESKPIAEGLKAMEIAMVGYLKSIDEEIKKQNGGGNTVVSTNNSKVVNNATTAVAMGFSHKNIGATRGMFGAPSSPLTPPS